jgi:hypothetical protein
LLADLRYSRSIAFALSGIAIHSIIFFPGWLSFDSAFQLWQARHWYFNNLSPVPMTVWLGVLLRTFNTDSAAPLFIFHLVLFWAGCALLLDGSLTNWRRTLVAVALFAVVTPLWWTLANVWTDTALLAGFTAGVGLIHSARAHRSRSMHWVALLALLYGSIARLNALPAAIPLFLLWWLARPYAPFALNRRSLLIAAAVAIFSVSLGSALDRLLASERVRTWPVQVLHDLAAISVRTGTLHVPAFARDPLLTVDTLRRAYTPYVAVSVLLTDPALRSGIVTARYSSEESLALVKAWLTSITQEPGAYIAHRAQMMGKLLVLPDRTNSYAITNAGSVPYKDNPPPVPLAGFAERIVFSLSHVAWRLHFSLLPYLIVLVALILQRIRANRSPKASVSLDAPFIDLLLISGILHLAPLLVLAPAADVRYVSWPVAAICLAAWLHFNAQATRTHSSSGSCD